MSFHVRCLISSRAVTNRFFFHEKILRAQHDLSYHLNNIRTLKGSKLPEISVSVYPYGSIKVILDGNSEHIAHARRKSKFWRQNILFVTVFEAVSSKKNIKTGVIGSFQGSWGYIVLLCNPSRNICT